MLYQSGPTKKQMANTKCFNRRGLEKGTTQAWEGQKIQEDPGKHLGIVGPEEKDSY